MKKLILAALLVSLTSMQAHADGTPPGPGLGAGGPNGPVPIDGPGLGLGAGGPNGPLMNLNSQASVQPWFDTSALLANHNTINGSLGDKVNSHSKYSGAGKTQPSDELSPSAGININDSMNLSGVTDVTNFSGR